MGVAPFVSATTFLSKLPFLGMTVTIYWFHGVSEWTDHAVCSDRVEGSH